MINLKQWLWQTVCDMDTDLIKSIVAHKKYKQIIYANLLSIWYKITEMVNQLNPEIIKSITGYDLYTKNFFEYF